MAARQSSPGNKLCNCVRGCSGKPGAHPSGAKDAAEADRGEAGPTKDCEDLERKTRPEGERPKSATDPHEWEGHEEGRARWAFHKYVSGDSAYGWEYDFVEKDHLGNTRVLLTQEKDTAHYIATMETATRATEDALFYGIDSTAYRIALIPGYPSGYNYTNPNVNVARVNGNGPKTGAAIILKVMSGDVVDLGVQYFYKSTGGGSSQPLSAADLLSALASGLSGLSAPAHAGFAALNNPTTSPLLVPLSRSLANATGTSSTKPQAYLNWVLLDNQFNYVSGNNQSGRCR